MHPTEYPFAKDRMFRGQLVSLEQVSCEERGDFLAGSFKHDNLHIVVEVYPSAPRPIQIRAYISTKRGLHALGRLGYGGTIWGGTQHNFRLGYTRTLTVEFHGEDKPLWVSVFPEKENI